MQYAIEMYFDRDSEQKIYDLVYKIADKNISKKFLEWKTRPHLTLACFNDVDEAKCIESLNRFAQGQKILPAYLSSVSMFTDTKTIFLSPTMNSSMYQFQRELHQAMEGFDTKGWEWYTPDCWVPHCTVALTREDGPDAFFQASDLVLREFQKIAGEFVSVGLVKISFPVEEIYTVALCR